MSFPSLLYPRPTQLAITLLASAAALALPAAAQQQHAHTHGRLSLDVAVDAQSITLAIESPLDGFLGFERAPRTNAERQRVASMVARLKAADGLFRIDPKAACRLATVELRSSALGLGATPEPSAQQHAQESEHDHEHADIDIDIVFRCTKAASASYIDVQLFDAFKRIRTIDAQVATPQGQFKHSLHAGAARLDLARR